LGIRLGYRDPKLIQKSVLYFWSNYKTKIIKGISTAFFPPFGVLLNTFSGFTHIENETLKRTNGSCEMERKYLSGFALKSAFNNEPILAQSVRLLFL